MLFFANATHFAAHPTRQVRQNSSEDTSFVRVFLGCPVNSISFGITRSLRGWVECGGHFSHPFGFLVG